jgi:hypothetical protein
MILLALALTAAQPMAPPITGGWSPVDQPGEDHDVRAAALALVRHLPVKGQNLRHIDSAAQQVVAGMRYRLTVRLTNGRVWRGTVWHRLDGQYQVSNLKILPGTGRGTTPFGCCLRSRSG